VLNSVVLIEQCAPQISPVLMDALVRAESAWRPLAIGMDKAQGTVKQPVSLSEAIATANALTTAGRKFSVGLAQIHVTNVALYGMTWEQAFDACQNLAIGQKILWNFYRRALASGYTGISAIWAALRGYNSGGVDRAVSDEYANRIFAYLSSAPPQVRIGNGVPNPKPAAENSAAQLAVAASTLEGGKPSESLDIFEKSEPTGF